MGYLEKSSGNKSSSKKSLDSNDLEEYLDFDLYIEDIAKLSDEIDESLTVDDDLESESPEIGEGSGLLFTGNKFHDEDDISDFDEDSDTLTEDGLDEILSKPLSPSEEEEEEISLSPEELLNIESSDTGLDYIDPDTSFDDHFASQLSDTDEEDTNITLGADELDNILGDSNSEPIVAHTPEELMYKEPVDEEDNIEVDEYAQNDPMVFESDEEVPSDEESDEDEEIALSGDELSNLLESGEFTEEEGEEYGKSFFDSEDDELTDDFENVNLDETTESSSEFEDEEPIALSGDELSNITGDYELEPTFETGIDEPDDSLEEIESDDENPDNFETTGESIFESEEEDESITLSLDELGNITADEEIEQPSSIFEEDVEDESITLSLDELGNITDGNIETEEAEGIFDPVLAEGEDESITLSPDELGNIVESDEVIEEEPTDIFAEDSSDEEIALSGDELSNLLESGDFEVEEAQSTPEPKLEISDEDVTEDFDSSDQVPEESDVSSFSSEEAPVHFESVKRKEMQKLMTYLDEMLGTMPEEFVKEFAGSEYFDLYKKIMSELEL
ncbi:MAG: hypothetical protein SFU98_11885 [Leptospiraceae bacterium]|nr:hypothetical protein [Leptospiraceae bacterium]